MAKIIVTGSLGLIGQSCCLRFLKQGHQVLGIDNDMRKEFFGAEASVKDQLHLFHSYSNYTHHWSDIRHVGPELIEGADLVVHCAAQPSHDWSYKNPKLDFDVNAVGTLNLLELVRCHAPNATFVFLSTNKVYGDRPNYFNLVEDEFRYIQKDGLGVNESMSVDSCVHSIFGVSKLSADLLVQEYGRNLGIKSAIFRCGCLTGKNHKGAELHGFLSYLTKCIKEGKHYTVYGYKGKQVRDNIHADDIASCVEEVFKSNICFGEVFNLGGSFENNISMLEAISYFEKVFEKKLSYTIVDNNRTGDHKWYITDMSKFRSYFPGWRKMYDFVKLMRQFA